MFDDIPDKGLALLSKHCALLMMISELNSALQLGMLLHQPHSSADAAKAEKIKTKLNN